MSKRTQQSSDSPGQSRFATTHWSVVLAAGKSSSVQHEQALSTLCQTYWFPLYAYLRRGGYSADEAADYTQGFFAQMLAKHYLKKVKRMPGKFRSFLLASLKHFVANERARARAKKRGGGRKVLSFDFENAESQYALEPTDDLSPDKVFEKSWALTVLERTMDRLESELASKNRQKLFDYLKVYLGTEASSVPYSKAAAELDMSEGSVRVAVHRLRRRCRELLRDEIAQTVASDEQIDDEIRGLFAVLTG
ncbi:MAG: sigma-70 family RNA polymerase sigma factor [Phycisphaerae bacterium]|nr:sigma-70 family RNA polymerase sigma factor [Phycisphaerae bacterium]NIS54773.1 sigma-70 family RNA polymerase sigma factor [Phycisphaerae bacterium]NIU12373.1 sigma-70 family RNA polymerase sigma factor [Phycisphaerae bacterium]NIU60267.1 sigma-70 family RNA polymerase sigma factor [Phycisphaerae bacterium]NIV02126.1 sigma-70 family RNA polymerase sigma factor [Phycisphaerae bacterium]